MGKTVSTTSNDPYLDLVLTFPLRPIRTRAAHRRGKEMLRSLIGKKSSAVRDYKSVLAGLIADYERSAKLRLDTSGVTAAQVVAHLLEQRRMSANALSKTLDIPQSSLSEMLSGQREWSKTAIFRVSEFFGLSTDLFLR